MAMSPVVSSVSELADYLEWLRVRNYVILENEFYDKVDPVHGEGSFHYDSSPWKGRQISHAADINWKNQAEERQMLLRAMKEAQYRGLAVVFAAEGTVGAAARHKSHLHVDIGTFSNVGKGLIKARKIRRPRPPKPKVTTAGKYRGRNLRKGDVGPRVLALQKRLKKVYPAYAGKIVLDSVYGPDLESKVFEFQRRAGLVPDKVAGAATHKALGLRF